MAIIARFDKYGKGVASDGVAADCTANVVAGADQVAVDAMNIGPAVHYVGLVLNLLLVACGAQGIGGCHRTRLLGVDFVTVDAGDSNIAVLA